MSEVDDKNLPAVAAEETTTDVISPDDVLPPLKPLSIFDLCETDDNASEDGKWFHDVFASGDGISIKLRRFTSRRAVNYQTVLLKKYQRYGKDGVFPPDINERIITEQLVNTIIVDWKGILGRDGKEIPYSVNAALLLTKMQEFRIRVLMIANSAERFRAEAQQAVEGNS